MAIKNFIPTIPILTPDDRYWRIDWLGKIDYNNTTNISSQPSIHVAISPFDVHDIDNGIASNPLNSNINEQRNVWIPVGKLPFLKIGSIWNNGVCSEIPDYELVTFNKLRIEMQFVSYTKAGVSEYSEFILPLSSHPWHISHTNSYCIQVWRDDFTRILIPALELIRFYFGSTSDLLIKLFTEPLRKEMLWEEFQYDETERHLHIHLADNLNGYSASDIGRIAMSQDAWNSAKGIHQSMIKTKNDAAKTSFVYTNFPFKGHTNFIASGIWLKANSKGIQTFVVFNIRSCSFKFPFKSLSYTSKNKSNWRKNNNSGQNGGGSHGQKGRISVSIDDSDPSMTKTPTIGHVSEKHRFPDLISKSIWKEQVDDQSGTGPSFLKKDDGTFETISTGDPYRPGDGRQIDLGIAPLPQEIDLQKLPAFVKKVIEPLIYANTTFEILVPEGYTQPVFPLPKIQDENGNTDPMIIFTPKFGKTRHRKGCMLEIKNKDGTLSRLVIVEGAKPGDEPQMGSSWKKLGFPFRFSFD